MFCIMQFKLQYETDLGQQALPYIDLTEFPREGEVLDIGAGVTLQVLEVTKTPSSGNHAAIAYVRSLTEAVRT